jgi:hypothetical protein
MPHLRGNEPILGLNNQTDIKDRILEATNGDLQYMELVENL